MKREIHKKPRGKSKTYCGVAISKVLSSTYWNGVTCKECLAFKPEYAILFEAECKPKEVDMEKLRKYWEDR